MSYNLKWEKDGVYIKYFDELTSQDLINSNSELVGSVNFDRAQYVISDFENIKGIKVDERDVKISKDFAVRVNPVNPMIKVAIISNHGELMRLIKQYIDDTQIQVPHAQQKSFENIVDARDWISG